MSAVIAAFCSSVIPGAAATIRQFSSATSTPASVSVGASTPGTRSAVETASSRSCPASIWLANSPSPETPAVTWPPSTAASASPPPEKAM